MSILHYGNDLAIPPHHIAIGSTGRVDYYYCELLQVGADLPSGWSVPATPEQILAAGGIKIASLFTNESNGSYTLVFNSSAYRG